MNKCNSLNLIMKKSVLALLLISFFNMNAQEMLQEKLPFYEIPEQPKQFTAGTVAARMVDGLGFRYFWATEGLTEKDLKQKASESSRTSLETIEHIYNLSKVIRNNVLIDNKDLSEEKLSFEATRKRTLNNLKLVSDVLRDTNEAYDLENTGVSFWNIINGPIADATWHCGQIAMLRRASGNPFSSKVNLFTGKLKD